MSKINDYGENTTANESDVYVQETSNGTRKITFSTILNGILSKFLKSTSKSSLTAASKGSASSREYAVGLDANGKMSVNVPWSDTDTVTTVVNNLTSSSTTSALSAAQGRYLNNKIDGLDSPEYAVGSKTHTINAPQTVSGTINYGKTFSSVPKVFLSISNPTGVRIETWVRNVTKTDFEAVIYSEAITANTSVTINWLAIL